MEHPSQAEVPKPAEIYGRIEEIHEDFFAQVPNYDRTIWSPQEALKLKAGGCMAELLYVAGGLLQEGKVDKDDLSIRFSKEHGQTITADMLGRSKADFKHVVLMLSIDGKQYECDFRMNRADEKPQFEAVPPDDEIYNNDRVEFFAFEDGIREYATRAGAPLDQVPSALELASLHQPGGPSYEADQVRFDQDF